jgi:hypothetical protein
MRLGQTGSRRSWPNYWLDTGDRVEKAREQSALRFSPCMPWPVLSHRLAYWVAPMIGIESGVIDHSPFQNAPLSTSPPPSGNASRITMLMVARRFSSRLRS